MSTPLARALEGLRRQLALDDVGAHVERVDVEPGGDLVVTLGGPRRARWFRHGEGGLSELTPEGDSRLPLAESLEQDRVLSYRPGRRMVVERARNGARSVVKGYRRKRSQPAAAAHRLAEQAAQVEGPRVAKLLEHRLEDEALVFDHLEGGPLSLARGSAERFFSLGAALRHFQNVPLDAAKRRVLGSYEARDELAVLETRAERAALALGELPEGWRATYDELAQACALLTETLDGATLGLAHRDLHDGQLLATSGGIALLDFDQLTCADVALDPANLLAHLSLRALQGIRGATEEGVLACGEAFLEGLNRGPDELFWTRLRFFESATFLRLALIYALRPRWKVLSAELIRLGRVCLEDLARIG